MNLSLHLPLLQRIVLRCTRSMAHSIDSHRNMTRLTHHDQRLQSHAIMVVEQDLIHLHRVRLKVELAIRDFHRIDRLRRSWS